MQEAKQSIRDLLRYYLPEVSLNGDRFLLSVSTSQLSNMLAIKAEEYREKSSIFITTSEGKIQIASGYENSAYSTRYLCEADYVSCILPLEFPSDPVKVYYKRGIISATALADYNGVNYVPMLIPLTKDGKLDEKFSKDFPDMSETVGGCFRFEDMDGKVCWYGTPKHLPDYILDLDVPNLKQKRYKSIQLVEWSEDSGCDPIRWVSFCGVLIAGSPLFHSSLRKLKEYGLLMRWLDPLTSET